MFNANLIVVSLFITIFTGMQRLRLCIKADSELRKRGRLVIGHFAATSEILNPQRIRSYHQAKASTIACAFLISCVLRCPLTEGTPACDLKKFATTSLCFLSFRRTVADFWGQKHNMLSSLNSGLLAARMDCGLLEVAHGDSILNGCDLLLF
ncbi:hypothetical protein ACA910_000367 [Epithemia clementina (nom. ined.)]